MQKVNGYYRLAKISINTVFNRLLKNKRVTVKLNNVEYDIKGGSMRYHVFHRSLVCVGCGKVANIAYVEKSHLSEPFPHVNFYYKDDKGRCTLFTKDHIKPKSKGGPNTLENLQTMCTNCNREKGDKYEEPNELRILQDSQ